MKAEIIIVQPGKKITGSAISINPHSRQELMDFRGEHAPAVCLIAPEQFRLLHNDNSDLFYKCGRKHSDKSLSLYNRKPDMIQLIDGSHYRDFGQLNRSINDFFNKRENNSLELLIFLGVDASLLTEARKRIQAEPEAGRHRQRDYADNILDLLKPLKYPKILDEIFIGQNEVCLKVKEYIWNAANNDLSVLIMGDTGTGKEVVAQAIHELSRWGRMGKHMITVNCGAIPEYLFESEIFGHVKGAFTGAMYSKTGKWELANDSTLFLDEIGDLALHHQVKILRALDEHIIYRVGGTKPVKVNARIIAATNKGLTTMMQAKKPQFRLDLYHRLATFRICTQPLSCHPEDIPQIARHLWRKICRSDSAQLSPQVLARLGEQYWPGNVRSLKHFLERIDALFGRRGIEVMHVDSLIEEEISNYIYPPRFGPDGKADKEKKKGFEKEIQQIESLLKIARKSGDAEKQSTLMMKSLEWLKKIVEDQSQIN